MILPMLRVVFVFLSLALTSFSTLAQPEASPLERMIAAEHSFAKLASEKGNRTAFLSYLTDDAIMFVPDKSNAKTYWTNRPESPVFIAWAPNFADISSNGLMGYTTGNAEYRLKGKDDQPTVWGHFVTVWLRQPDGNYKWVLDLGINHPKPEKYSTEWVTARESRQVPNKVPAADAAHGFLMLVNEANAKKAYSSYAADSIRMYREGQFPMVGKAKAVAQIGSEKGQMVLGEKSTFFGAADLAYSTSTYSRIEGGKAIEKGNFVQIWKLIDGKWQIVLDIFKALPEQK
jgi:ketosteroid isomerase-like protein